MTVEEVIEFVSKEISYDGSAIYKCERCGHAPTQFWIDHKSSLASNIASYLGIKDSSTIYSILESVYTEGNPRNDAKAIAVEIDDKVMGLANSTK